MLMLKREPIGVEDDDDQQENVERMTIRMRMKMRMMYDCYANNV